MSSKTLFQSDGWFFSEIRNMDYFVYSATHMHTWSIELKFNQARLQFSKNSFKHEWKVLFFNPHLENQFIAKLFTIF